MADTQPEDVVAEAMRPIIGFDVPPVLRSSIERQGRNLRGLVHSLLQSGMDEDRVRAVVDQACSSYRDELTSAILALRKRHET